MMVYLNGKMVDASQATVGVFDAGFQHAAGLFETMGVYHRRAFRLTQHLDRLQRSADELGLAPLLDTDELHRAVDLTIQHNPFDHARLRLTLTPGVIPGILSGILSSTPPRRGPSIDQEQNSHPTVLVVATPPTQYDPACFDRGIAVTIAPAAGNPLDLTAGHKTLSYWSRLRVLRQAALEGAGEAIWFDAKHHLASGSISNLFIIKNNQLMTPFARGESSIGSSAAPVLPGVTRAAVIELAQNARLPVQRRMLTVDDLRTADEVFLTNSSWLVLPVTRVGSSRIGDGQVGLHTRKLRTALIDLIEQESSPRASTP